jgi:hypothetical protein
MFASEQNFRQDDFMELLHSDIIDSQPFKPKKNDSKDFRTVDFASRFVLLTYLEV